MNCQNCIHHEYFWDEGNVCEYEDWDWDKDGEEIAAIFRNKGENCPNWEDCKRTETKEYPIVMLIEF